MALCRGRRPAGGALRRERWPSGGGLAFEFEVVSGRVADEHRVVVRSVLRPQPRLVEDLGAGCGGELVDKSDGRLVLDPERKVGLATTGVGRKGEEQLGWLARQGVPDQVRHIEGSRAPGQADDLVVPVADGVQVVDLEDDMVEQRHGRSPVLLRPRSAAAASRSAATSSLATGWSWLVMAWAMLPGLMNLTRMSASGGMEIGYLQLTANSRVRCPGIKKSGPCNATADFTDGPARDRSLTSTLHAFPQNKNAGRPFGARHRLHRPSPGPARLDPPPEPRYRRRTGTEPAPGPAGMPPGRSQGQARMTLPAATAPDAEGRTPARGTQL